MAGKRWVDKTHIQGALVDIYASWDSQVPHGGNTASKVENANDDRVLDTENEEKQIAATVDSTVYLPRQCVKFC